MHRTFCQRPQNRELGRQRRCGQLTPPCSRSRTLGGGCGRGPRGCTESRCTLHPTAWSTGPPARTPLRPSPRLPRRPLNPQQGWVSSFWKCPGWLAGGLSQPLSAVVNANAASGTTPPGGVATANKTLFTKSGLALKLELAVPWPSEQLLGLEGARSPLPRPLPPRPCAPAWPLGPLATSGLGLPDAAVKIRAAWLPHHFGKTMGFSYQHIPCKIRDIRMLFI